MTCCGGGFSGGAGGSGNLSGNLNSPQMPVASGPHTLVDTQMKFIIDPTTPIANMEGNRNASLGLIGAGVEVGFPPEFSVRGARGGSIAAPAAVQDGDLLGDFRSYGYLAGYSGGGYLRFGVDGVPAAGVPTRGLLISTDSAGAQKLVAEFNARGEFYTYGPLVVGTRSKLTPASLGIAAGLVALDANLSDFYRLTVTGNCTISNPTNFAAGRKFLLRLKMGGAFTVSFDTAFKFSGGAPTIDTTLNSFTYLGFFANEDGNTWDCIGPAIGPF